MNVCSVAPNPFQLHLTMFVPTPPHELTNHVSCNLQQCDQIARVLPQKLSVTIFGQIQKPMYGPAC